MVCGIPQDKLSTAPETYYANLSSPYSLFHHQHSPEHATTTMSAAPASSSRPVELASNAATTGPGRPRNQKLPPPRSMLDVLPENPVDRQSHDGSDEDTSSSPDPDQDDVVEDQDDAQAVLQPAMSAAAVHLASAHTPAAEKAAALDKSVGDYMFDSAALDGDDGDADDGELAAATTKPSTMPATAPSNVQSHKKPTPGSSGSRPAMSLGRLPSSGQAPPRADLPSPWHVGSTFRPFNLGKDSTQSTRYSRLLPARGVLESAFAPTRNRSRSAGQEALKRIQKALPSFSTPTHLLPSLPSSFFSSSSSSSSNPPAPKSPTTKQKASQATPPSSSNNMRRFSSPLSPLSETHQGSSPLSQTPSSGPVRPGPPRRSASIHSRHSGVAAPAVRPPMLRRATSDESMLYHSLSRTSSLNDGEKFNDVREMVNLRFQAMKESLPDVSNFKMRIPTPSFISANSMSSTDGSDLHPSSRWTGLNNDAGGVSDLDIALQELTGDVVIMGGFRGSVLRSAHPPHQQCWAPVKLGFNMRKVNLEVGLDDEADEHMEEQIIPSGMLTHVGPIDISRKLIRKLQNCENARKGKLRVWNYGYDWRLSPALLSRKLREFLEGLPSNNRRQAGGPQGALVISHSLGGVITRHAVNQAPELFSGVLYAGTPLRCINILGPIRNGDVVLLNEKLLSAKVNFSMRTSYVFLPEDGFCFIDKKTKEEYTIDFFDPQEWMRYRLSPCMLPPLPARSRPAPSPTSPSLSSFLPTALRARAQSRSGSQASPSLTPDPAPGHEEHATAEAAAEAAMGHHQPNHNQHNHGLGVNSAGARPSSSSSAAEPSSSEQERNMAFLERTLPATRKFRAELAHRTDHQSRNAYPPFAVLYSKTTPTVYAAQVDGREGIPCVDAYDDLVFRAGDGVVLAKESMLPEGYSAVRGGKVHTDRGHITMLGDMPAVGQCLRALLRGRRKGIGINPAPATVGEGSA